MPRVGDEEFAYTDEGIAAAQEKSEATGIPISDSMNRNVTEYAGGGKTGYSKIGMYKEGDLVKEPRKRYSAERKIEKGEVKEKKDSLKRMGGKELSKAEMERLLKSISKAEGKGLREKLKELGRKGDPREFEIPKDKKKK